MEVRIDKEEIQRISGVNPRKCMRCGKCSATCPSYEEMEYHPHQFVYMVEEGLLEPLMKSASLSRSGPRIFFPVNTKVPAPTEASCTRF